MNWQLGSYRRAILLATGRMVRRPYSLLEPAIDLSNALATVGNPSELP